MLVASAVVTSMRAQRVFAALAGALAQLFFAVYIGSPLNSALNGGLTAEITCNDAAASNPDVQAENCAYEAP